MSDSNDNCVNFLICRAVWLLYIIFTCIHLYANYRAVTCLEIETLNRPRLLMCVQEYINSGNVSSVKVINQRESVILGSRGLLGTLFLLSFETIGNKLIF